MRFFPFIAALALSACGEGNVQPPKEWKETYTAAECKALVSVQAIETRCGDGNRQRLEKMMHEDPSLCLPYSSSRPMSGIWVDGFEYSAFFEGARSWNDVSRLAFDSDQERTWLSAKDGANLPVDQNSSGLDYKVYRLEIVGKRSLCAFGYGHSGGSEREVWAEQIISITPLETVQEPRTSTVR